MSHEPNLNPKAATKPRSCHPLNLEVCLNPKPEIPQNSLAPDPNGSFKPDVGT